MEYEDHTISDDDETEEFEIEDTDPGDLDDSDEPEPEGVCMATRNGCLVNLLHPTPDWVDPESVARTLCNINRYAGNYGEYSVAQHSVLVSMMIELLKGDPYEQWSGLWHDASEVITNDVPRPVKIAIDYFGGGFSEIESRLNECINERFGVWVDDPIVKTADLAVFANEVLRLVPREFRHLYMPLPEAHKLLPYSLMTPWGPEAAYHRFMDRHEKLQAEVHKEMAAAGKKAGYLA